MDERRSTAIARSGSGGSTCSDNTSAAKLPASLQDTHS
jgi:hypothetical protein